MVRRTKEKRKSMPLWQELPLLLVVAFCLAVLIRTFLLQAFFIPSGSMEDTLLVGDRVLVNKVVYDVREPERGEVVVFRGTDNWVPGAPAEPPDDGFFAGSVAPSVTWSASAARGEGLHQAGHRRCPGTRGLLRRRGPGHVNGTAAGRAVRDRELAAGRAARSAGLPLPPVRRGHRAAGSDVRDGRPPPGLPGLPLPGPGADRQRDRSGLRDRLAEQPVGPLAGAGYFENVPGPSAAGVAGGPAARPTPPDRASRAAAYSARLPASSVPYPRVPDGSARWRTT